VLVKECVLLYYVEDLSSSIRNRQALASCSSCSHLHYRQLIFHLDSFISTVLSTPSFTSLRLFPSLLIQVVYALAVAAAPASLAYVAVSTFPCKTPLMLLIGSAACNGKLRLELPT